MYTKIKVLLELTPHHTIDMDVPNLTLQATNRGILYGTICATENSTTVKLLNGVQYRVEIVPASIGLVSIQITQIADGLQVLLSGIYHPDFVSKLIQTVLKSAIQTEERDAMLEAEPICFEKGKKVHLRFRKNNFPDHEIGETYGAYYEDENRIGLLLQAPEGVELWTRALLTDEGWLAQPWSTEKI